MKEKELTWQDITLFGFGSLAGALLGVLAVIGLAEAMAAKAPGFWFVSRATGLVAYLLLWASTASGIMISAKGIGGFVSGPLAYTVHNVTSWLALGFTAVHGLSLLGDRVISFTPAGVLIPFAASYQPVLTGLGVVAFYIGLLVSVSFYLTKRIGYKTWRAIHYVSYLMFLFGTIHGALLGTDSKLPVMQAIYLLAAGSVFFLTMFRILTAGAGSTNKAQSAA